MNTLFSKFLIRFILISLISIIILGFSMIYFFENFYFERKEQEIISNSRAVRGFLAQALTRNNQQQLENWLQILSEVNDGIAMLVNEEGFLQMSSPFVAEPGSRFNVPSQEEITAGNVITSRIDSEYFERPMLLIGIPVTQPEEVYSLLVLNPVAGINQTVNQVQQMMLYSALIAIVLGTIVAFKWSRNLSEPLRKMSQVALQLSNGAFGKTVSVEEKNEIGTLARSINYMSQKLNQTIDNLMEERNKLRHILTGMEEGVIAINDREEIILINNSARTFLDIKEKDSEKTRMSHIIKNQEIKDIFKESTDNKRELQKEFYIKNERENKKKRVLVHCTPIFIEDDFFGVVGLIHDISRRWRFEQLQKDFVANVSHELKTPLSSIKGAGEVLLDDVLQNPEQKKEYLNIILEEADRLKELVNNILKLSEVEGKKQEYNARRIEVNKLVSRTARIFKKKNDKAERDINLVLEKEDVFVEGNEKRFKQILFNLLDNAFKFSPADKKVELGVALVENSRVKIWVADQGIGIPAEEQKNIWERFYKVDKAHTPNDNGSGLGLAIVKRIVEKYNGEVFVESEYGKGSQIGFYLPVC